ncbi:1-deoxy-D-xylulose-5-phosphate reductoisomerase [Fusobacterium sp. PH5-44]|uniref:1-deoxy-D-xylulose-5-phosphate reductoisomerase n=1 Tax=unclassified Fusobacterium TaxID=2648384 RepID=UPI003D1D1E19
MKKIVILGSTGSIGTSALEVIRNEKDKYQVLGLSGHSNHSLLIDQIKEFDPQYISIGNEEGYKILKELFPQKEIFFGEEGLVNLANLDDYHILLTAITGAVGIEATITGIKKEKKIALANKETMVSAGKYINRLLKEHPKSSIIPVDSEHSAIFQCLQCGSPKEVSKLIITASGGSFRDKDIEFIKNATVEDALKHPNWVMGKKITIDSATLINKGLEVIEAHELFHINYNQIKVLIHPQSIVHSMVEFVDQSVIAQLALPDMKLPIQYAFSYPERLKNPSIEQFDYTKMSMLTFEEPQNNVFKGIELAYAAGRTGKSMPIVFNATNEVAVKLFLDKRIKFLDIYKIVEYGMSIHNPIEINDVHTIKSIDKEIRRLVLEKFGKK